MQKELRYNLKLMLKQYVEELSISGIGNKIMADLAILQHDLLGNYTFFNSPTYQAILRKSGLINCLLLKNPRLNLASATDQYLSLALFLDLYCYPDIGKMFIPAGEKNAIIKIIEQASALEDCQDINTFNEILLNLHHAVNEYIGPCSATDEPTVAKLKNF